MKMTQNTGFKRHIGFSGPYTASIVGGRLLLRSLGTIGFRDVTEMHPCDVTEINLGVNDRAHGEGKRPSN